MLADHLGIAFRSVLPPHPHRSFQRLQEFFINPEGSRPGFHPWRQSLMPRFSKHFGRPLPCRRLQKSVPVLFYRCLFLAGPWCWFSRASRSLPKMLRPFSPHPPLFVNNSKGPLLFPSPGSTLPLCDFFTLLTLMMETPSYTVSRSLFPTCLHFPHPTPRFTEAVVVPFRNAPATLCGFSPPFSSWPFRAACRGSRDGAILLLILFFVSPTFPP